MNPLVAAQFAFALSCTLIALELHGWKRLVYAHLAAIPLFFGLIQL